ncbi:MAG: hypothetical protein ACR2KJ_00690 [Jatrophihabitans sp.]
MGKLISIALSAIVGAALSIVAAVAVVQSATKAPNKNPVSGQLIDYGNR